MARIIWTEPALQDLSAIAEYIALDKVSAARKLVERVFQRVQKLTKFPASGRRLPELKRSQYREVVVGPCRVFYRVEGSKVLILHIMRGEQKLREYLLEERAREKENEG